MAAVEGEPLVAPLLPARRRPAWRTVRFPIPWTMPLGAAACLGLEIVLLAAALFGGRPNAGGLAASALPLAVLLYASAQRSRRVAEEAPSAPAPGRAPISATPLLCLAGVGLAAIASQIKFPNGWPLVWAGLVIAAPLTAWLLWLGGRVRTADLGTCLGVGLVATLYAYGAAAQLDTVLDRRPVRQLRSLVLEQQSFGGGKSHHYLVLSPDDGSGSYIEKISGRMNDELKPGGSVCTDMYGGLLGVPWRHVHLCFASGPRKR